MHGVSCFGFNLGIVDAGNEYSQFTDSYAAWNNIGVANLPASFSDGTNPSQIASPGAVSIDNHFSGIISVHNTVANWVFNGSNTNTVRGGSSSNGGMADLILGAIDRPFLASITMAGAGSANCPANTTQRLVITGGGSTLPATGVVYIDTKGHPTPALTSLNTPMVDESGNYLIPTINGGADFTSPPTVTLPGCSGPPTLTANLKAYTGVLPFRGDAKDGKGNLLGAGQNYFEENDLENEGANVLGLNRNASGFQVLEDVSANENTIRDNSTGMSNGGYQFQHFLRDEGYHNYTTDNNLPALVDPATGSTCQILETQGGNFSSLSKITDPENQACAASTEVADYGGNVKFLGWHGNRLAAHGFSSTGSTTAKSGSDVALENVVPGEAYPRKTETVNGTVALGSGSTLPDVAYGRLSAGAWGMKIGMFGILGSSGDNPGLHFTSGGTAYYYRGNLGLALDPNFNVLVNVAGNSGFRVGRGDTRVDLFAVDSKGNGTFHGKVSSPYLSLSPTLVGTCNASTAGTFEYVQAGPTTKDIVQVCAHDARNTYAWRIIY